MKRRRSCGAIISVQKVPSRSFGRTPVNVSIAGLSQFQRPSTSQQKIASGDASSNSRSPMGVEAKVEPCLDLLVLGRLLIKASEKLPKTCHRTHLARGPIAVTI